MSDQQQLSAYEEPKRGSSPATNAEPIDNAAHEETSPPRPHGDKLETLITREGFETQGPSRGA